VGRVERSDLVLEEFLVQHDMENYMYAFRQRPQNALQDAAALLHERTLQVRHSRDRKPPGLAWMMATSDTLCPCTPQAGTPRVLQTGKPPGLACMDGHSRYATEARKPPGCA